MCKVRTAHCGLTQSRLFIVSLQAVSAEGTGTQGSTNRMHWDTSFVDCNSTRLMATLGKRCFGPLVHRYGMAKDFKFTSIRDYGFVRMLLRMAFATCRDEQEVRDQVAEGYRCYYSIAVHCISRGDMDDRNLYKDLELYMPDPDLSEDFIDHVCGLTDAELMCFVAYDTEVTHLSTCLLRDIGPFMSLITETTDIKTLVQKNIKPLICSFYQGLQRCVRDRTKQCAQPSAAYLDTLFRYLLPPACQNTDGWKNSEHFFNEL